MTDAEALALVRRGRCEGLEWLMERYTRYVGAVASRILAGRLGQEDAEEVVSDAFLALWRAARSLRTESVRAWLGTTARNLALNRLRAAHFDAELSEDTLRLDADPAQALEDRNRGGGRAAGTGPDDLSRALLALPQHGGDRGGDRALARSGAPAAQPRAGEAAQSIGGGHERWRLSLQN